MLVEELAPSGRVVVVDDGSTDAHAAIFLRLSKLPGVVLLRHAVNLGKGAALKTGFNHILTHHPEITGTVTADADGQHLPSDILRIAAQLSHTPESLVLGTRLRHEQYAPLRSRLGNRITRVLVRLLMGKNLADTQTGLRGVPGSLMKRLLAIPSAGYDFELDMLVASKHLCYDIVQVPIETVYLEGNRSSHFNPLFDSMKVYFVLLRFASVGLLTAFIDNAVFLLVFAHTQHVLLSQASGRLAAVGFNYTAARRAVFLAKASHSTTLPRYLLLVALNTALSYAFIEFAVARLGWSVPLAKLTAEGALFAASFALQRDFVFTARPS